MSRTLLLLQSSCSIGIISFGLMLKFLRTLIMLDIMLSQMIRIHSAVQRFPDWIFYGLSSNAIYRAMIELRSWNRFSQECKLALV